VLLLQMLALIVTSPFPDQADAQDAAKDAARQQNTMELHVLGMHHPIRAQLHSAWFECGPTLPAIAVRIDVHVIVAVMQAA
jgi:hypothetical protein